MYSLPTSSPAGDEPTDRGPVSHVTHDRFRGALPGQQLSKLADRPVFPDSLDLRPGDRDPFVASKGNVLALVIT